MIERRVDEDVGIIYVTAEGHWSHDEVEDHQQKLAALLAEFRVNGRRIRVLSDVSRAPRQSPEIEQRVRDDVHRIYRKGDRVAILTGSEEDRSHVRSMVGDVEIALFTSRLAAEMWLLHDRMDVPASGTSKRR